MNEDYKITETNPGGIKTRYSVRKGSGQPVIFTTRRGAEEHVARQTTKKESVLSFGEFINEITVRDAAGKKHQLGNVKFRGADGKIHSAPPGKSGSSGGGGDE